MLGAVVGGVVTMLTPKEYSATSSVYIGQTTDALGQAMAGLNSNPKAATQLLASQALLNEAAKATGMGMTSGKLRRETTVETPSQTIKTTVSAVNIVVITVTDTKKVRAAAAANALANALVAKLSPSVEAKVTLLEEQLAAGHEGGGGRDGARATRPRRRSRPSPRAAALPPRRPPPPLPTWPSRRRPPASSPRCRSPIRPRRCASRSPRPSRCRRSSTWPRCRIRPAAPSRTLNVAAGALAGLVVGVIVAFVRRRVRGA